MAGRSTYTEADRAKVFTVLAANDGNIKRTARETNVPENTVRRWKKEFISNPPDTEQVTVAVDEFLETAEVVRGFALEMLLVKIPIAKPSELITIVGVLDDKITRAKGLATQRTEHVLTLPTAEELRNVLGPAIQQAIIAAETRQDEIVEAEIVAEVDVMSLPA